MKHITRSSKIFWYELQEKHPKAIYPLPFLILVSVGSIPKAPNCSLEVKVASAAASKAAMPVSMSAAVSCTICWIMISLSRLYFERNLPQEELHPGSIMLVDMHLG